MTRQTAEFTLSALLIFGSLSLLTSRATALSMNPDLRNPSPAFVRIVEILEGLALLWMPSVRSSLENAAASHLKLCSPVIKKEFPSIKPQLALSDSTPPFLEWDAFLPSSLHKELPVWVVLPPHQGQLTLLVLVPFAGPPVQDALFSGLSMASRHIKSFSSAGTIFGLTRGWARSFVRKFHHSPPIHNM